MPCRRCGGLMVPDDDSDLCADPGSVLISARRCICCGDIVDSVILQNRQALCHADFQADEIALAPLGEPGSAGHALPRRRRPMNTLTAQPQSMHDILSRYEPYLQDCRDHIAAGLASTALTRLVAEYFRRGKMFRALLVFIAASATGTQPRKMSVVAEAIELLHGASLIHDDIVDEAVERRGHPALQVQLGIGPALVLGDYLILRSFAVLGQVERVYGPEATLAAWRTLNGYAQGCCQGQFDELRPSRQFDLEADYLAIARGKTGAPFAAAASLPGILAGSPLVERDALRTYGFNLGIAFQIHDDTLDLTGDAETLGKPVGNLLRNARPMLPLIYLRCYGSTAARRTYQRMQATGKHDHAELASVLKEEGIGERVRATQERYLAAAMRALDRLRPSDDVMAMKTLALYATTQHSVPLHAERKADRGCARPL
jgi:geranylgeranyl pyrophosphate synthase